MQNFENSNFIKSEPPKNNEPTMPTIGINIQNISTPQPRIDHPPPQVKYENPIDRHLSQQYPPEQPVYRAERHASNSQISTKLNHNSMTQNLPIPRKSSKSETNDEIHELIAPKAIYRNSDGKKITMVHTAPIKKKKSRRRNSGVPVEFLENLSRELEKVQQQKQKEEQRVPKIEPFDFSQETVPNTYPKVTTPPGVISSVFDSKKFGNQFRKVSESKNRSR